MAAAALLLFLLYCLSDASLDRRFSELKRCTDDECSMLLVRGKAVDDFSGPDCRFLSFKKSETIYVYYKLSGRRTDIWAGSVGNRFGYFPKDLLAVNHVYTEKELEVPAEETDFVCFDTGFDGFDDYNIDSLLGPSYLMQESEKRDEFDPTERAVEHSEASEEPSTEDGAVDGHDGAHDADLVQSASLTQELVIAEAVEQNVVGAPDPSETHEGETGETAGEREDEPKDVDDEPIQDDPHDDPGAERGFTSRGFQIPELKTTLGTTFEAVATDDEDTRKVTPYYEEEGEELMEDNVNLDVPTATPLLLSSDESTSAPETDPLDEGGLQQTPEDDEDDDDEDKDDDDIEMPTSETRNMLSSLGDAVFAIVSGGKQTADDLSSEEEEEDDDDENMEEMTPEKTLTTNEANEDLNRELEDEEPAAGDSPLLSEGQNDTDDDSERLLFDYDDDDDDDDDDGKNNSDWVEQTTDPEKTPTLSVGDRVDFDMDDSTPHQYKDKTPDEPAAQKVSEPPEPSDEQDDDDYRDDAHLQDGDTQKVTRLKEVETSTGHDESSAVDAKENGKSENSKSTDGHEKEGDDGSFERRLGRAVPEMEKTERRDVDRDSPADEEPSSKDEETQGEGVELLEDENAVLSTESHMPSSVGDALIPELEYSDGVLRLILLRDHFKEEDMERLRRFLSLRNLLKVEAMFSDLDLELQAARLSDMNTAEDIEKSLDGILEASENLILDEIEKMLDGRDVKHGDAQQTDTGVFDDEAELLDEFQELAFKLRQKYSAASDSTPLQTEGIPVLDQDDHTPSVGEDRAEIPPAVVEVQDHIVVFEEEEEEEEEGQMKNDSATVEEEEAHIRAYVDDARERRDLGVTVDGGHFNNNKDNQPSYGAAEDIQKSPPAVLDKPFDLGLGVEVEHSSSGSLDSVEPTADFNEEEPGLFSSGMSYYILCILATVKTKMTDWVVVIISLLPEEWKPGETLLGCPWQAVVATALVGVVSVTHFFWKTVLAVKKKEYLVTEKGLHNQILALNKEKSNAVLKTSELQTRIDELREKQKQSDETASCALKRNCDLERKVLDSEGKNKRLAEKVRSYRDLLEDGKAKMETNDARMEKLVKANEKLQLSRQKTEKTLAETTVLLDEAKLRDDARNIQHKCLQRDHAALKEENKTLKVTMKGWEEKHQNLNQQIKVYQKSQKELEDSVAFKDHNVEVLSELLADLDACDMQKGDAKVLANGEVLSDKKTMIKNHIKQMMDVARVKTTLSVVEEERDRYMTKLLHVEKARKALEEQHQQLEHAISTLKSEKSHVQNQFQILQQKNEIMTEMYQQKEHALQQKLTKEELERRSRETLLSEVGGKAVETESHVKVLRQRINEMDEQMKKTEVAYKEQIKEQENKTHTNWVNARNAERALNQEKVETSKLREKLAVLSSRLNEHRAHLFRPNPGQTLAPRQAGDSFGASPVSGGAPSPPLMIEGPRRPPSAPLGRRIDPYGPRPTSDPHGRYLDNKHNSGIDAAAPRTSSPLTTDDPTVDSETPEAEASGEGPEEAAERLAIVDSPITAHGSPHGPHEAQQGPRGRLPPPGPYRPPPRPGPHGPLYPLPPGMMGPPPPHHHRPMPPANGHPGVPPYAPMGGEFGARPSNGHPLWPGADPRGPPPPHFRPPPPHHFGAMPPPPHGLRGPMGPRAPFPADMRFPGPGYPPVGPAFLPGGGGGGPPRPPPHGDAFTHPPPDAHRPPTGGGPGQGHPDAGAKQETTPQDSGQLTNTMAEP